MKILLRLIFVLSIVLFLTLVVHVPFVLAQDKAPEPSFIAPPTAPLNLTMSPITLLFNVLPGETVTKEIKIRNNSAQAEELKMTLGTFTADESGQRAKLLDFKPGDETASWIEFPTEPFIVEAGQWKTLLVKFSPPKSAALSYYYSFTFSRNKQIQGEGGKTAVNVSSILLVLSTVVSPDAKKEMQLLSFQAKNPIVEMVPAEFEVTVKNAGNVHLAPSGNIYIDSLGKKDVAILPVNDAISMILPNSQRSFTTVWKDGFPKSSSLVENGEGGFSILGMHVDFSQINKLRIGPHTAHLLMVYDDGQRDVPMESSITFWVIPWKILLVAGFVLLSVLTTLRSYIKGLVQRLLKPKTSSRS